MNFTAEEIAARQETEHLAECPLCGGTNVKPDHLWNQMASCKDAFDCLDCEHPQSGNDRGDVGGYCWRESEIERCETCRRLEEKCVCECARIERIETLADQLTGYVTDWRHALMFPTPLNADRKRVQAIHAMSRAEAAASEVARLIRAEMERG